jgi:hypothetical protein
MKSQRGSANEPGDVSERYQVCEAAFHPDWLEVRDGVNYVAGWHTAHATAARLRALLTDAGVLVSAEALWASVRADGAGVVCLDPSIAAALVRLADEALKERQEGAPKIRGTPEDRAA